MITKDWFEIGVSLLAALVFGRFAECSVHRLMHAGLFRLRTHVDHHRQNEGQVWFREFLDDLFPSLPVLPLGFMYSLCAGVGFAVGGVCYAAIAAYAHQIQHENPELVFWMRIPIHHTHHDHKMWRYNFRITLPFWDHVFRTYRKVEWKPNKRPFEYSLSHFFRIQWF